MLINLPTLESINRSAEGAELAGESSRVEYERALADIDTAIDQLKRHRADVQAMLGHTHEWSENDYCSLCGADGRA